MGKRIGEISLPVPQILQRLKVEDRDADGIMYATPVIQFDVRSEGRHVGFLFLSFETQTAPPSQKMLDADNCCWPEACSVEGRLACIGEDSASTCTPESTHRG